jgi:hypothetical protein
LPPSSACSLAISSRIEISRQKKFLAVSHLIGGVAMLSLACTRSFWPFFGAMLIHCLLYVPTISITNSIAFTHMKDPQKRFGIVRMGGTIGWILAAWPFTFILVDWAKVNAAPRGLVSWLGTVLASGLTGSALEAGTTWTFIVAGIASLALAAFSLTLPHTPPKPWKPARTVRMARGVSPAADAIHPDSVDRHLRRRDGPQSCSSTGPGDSSALMWRAVAWAFPGNWIMPVMSIGRSPRS